MDTPAGRFIPDRDVKKSLSYLFIIILFSLLVIFLLRNRSPFGKSNIAFAVDAGKEITRIEFNQGTERLTLVKDGEEWLVNGLDAARESSINFITSILYEVKIKSPVSEEKFNSEIRESGIEPVRVRVYERNRLLSSFYVYKTRSNIYGNIMKTRERSKPFIVYVPGFETNIGSAFTLKELYWKPYIVFNNMPSEIKSVTLENLSDTISSFSIGKNGSGYILSDNSGVLTGWDTASVARYLSYFIRIPFENWAFEVNYGDNKVEQIGDTLFRITVETNTGAGNTLTIMERIIPGEGGNRTDSDRVFGKTGDSDELFIMRYFDIDPVLKKKSYFFQE